MQYALKKSLFALLTTLSCAAWANATLHCVGTAPTWSLTLGKHWTLTLPTQTLQLTPVPAQYAAGMPKTFLTAYQTHTGKQSVTIVIQEAPDGCTDGESDNVYTHRVTVLWRNIAFIGCCHSVAHMGTTR
ncbi:MAG: hypothetical protein A3J38_02040 [Gammaproteobacteria bacterium RIFCSPHIGHO2_12_FULL_45_9]|nr:MAG: hypothetical protein A3J38_02040 [Gammaproteobacteria bacterium RIFCSPHIGHO2_12_FULL_45_9]